MYQFGLLDKTKQPFDLIRWPTHNAACLAVGIIHKASGNFLAGRIHAKHHIATAEAAHHSLNSNGQQRLSFFKQNSNRALIEHKSAFELQLIGHPLLTGCKNGKVGRK